MTIVAIITKMQKVSFVFWVGTLILFKMTLKEESGSPSLGGGYCGIKDFKHYAVNFNSRNQILHD